LRHQLDYWRQRLLEHIYPLTPSTHNRGVIAGLVLGYRADITQEQWRLLLETGTNHLVAISGLHIGLIAGLFYAAVIRLGVLLPLTPGAWPRQRIAALAAYVAAVVYAMLAGLALPTQRALIMLGVGLMGILAYRQLRPGYALLLALVLVLLFDPFAVLNPGFWLSFGAVAVLIYMAVGRRVVRQHNPRMNSAILRRGWLWGKLQWLLLLGILPLSVIWFGRVAVGGVAANLVAIPLVGMIVVPLVLLAAVVSLLSRVLAEWLFSAADWLLEVFWRWLELVSDLPFNLWLPPEPSWWALICAFVGLALLLAPRGLPGRWVGVLWLLPLLLAKPPVPGAGEFWLTALDVGQGTAVVVRTQRHTLVYDAGPRFSGGFNTGEAVVLPFLYSLGISRIDRLLISHGDNDHIGGAWALLEQIPVGTVLTSVPERFAFESALSRDGRADHELLHDRHFRHPWRSYTGAPVDRCRTGQQWSWDGIRFEILHPDASGEGNNASCVLQITAPGGRALLPGDIEEQAEQSLLRDRKLAPVALLVVPHHGSRTSSTAAFIDALRPAHAIVPAGYLNRYGFPKPDVVARYQQHNARVWVTGDEGAMMFEVGNEGTYPRMLYRREAGKYWHRKP
jgi:competence protein ComEC